MTAANSATAAMVAASGTSMPLSFDGDRVLFAVSLGGMTAMTVIGAAVAAACALSILKTWGTDRWNHPVTIFRALFLFAGLAAMLRCGAEATVMWSWTPLDPVTSARVQLAKRWSDLIALGCAWSWVILFALTRREMERHLQRRPLPLQIWAHLPSLKRPVLAVLLSFVCAAGVVWARG